MGLYLSGRAHVGAIFAAIVALAVAGGLLSGPVRGQSAPGEERPLLLGESDSLGVSVPREITATYGTSGGVPTNTSETAELRGHLLSQVDRAEVYARRYVLDLATSRFETAGQRFLGERFRVFSSLVWTQENRFSGSLTIVAPLRETARGITFLQPGLITWNGTAVGGTTDRRADFSLGLVPLVHC